MVLFIYHFAAVASIAFLPHDSALRWSVPVPVRSYLRVTGNHNRWNMFDAAPKFHSYQVELIASTGAREHVLGPVLPGLLPYDGAPRTYKLFLNLSRRNNERYRRAYLEAALRAAKDRLGPSVRRVWLRYHLGRTNSLSHIRKTGEVERKQVVDLGD